MKIKSAYKADIASRAMLISLSITQWAGRKLDKNATRDLIAQNGAQAGSGKFNKVLVARGALAKVQTVVSAARITHATYTLPWMQDGTRIMPVDAFTAYGNKMREHREAYDSAVRELLLNYDALKDQARSDLGALYNEQDYPPAHQIAKRFTWSVQTLPMPSATDFRVDMDSATVKAMQNDIQQQIDAQIAQAVGHTFERLQKVVKDMSDKLAAYDPNAENRKDKRTFKDSLVQNVRDLCDVLPSLNMTGNADLARTVEQVQHVLTQHDAQDLRDNDELRAKVQKDASAIVDAMAAFM